MGQNALLVGSVPLDTVENVMRTFGGTLGADLPAIPDGEVGERRSWVLRLSYQVFNGHIDLETISRPQRVGGVEQLMPRGRDDVWKFRVKPGVDVVRFGNPGYRLGYAKDAVNSYFVFKTLREKGEIPRGVRFQISMPMVNSVIRPLTFPEPGDLPKLRPGYEEAIAAEIKAILETIPHEDLAIQWDCAWEVAAVHDGIEGYPAEREIDTHVAPVGRLSKLLPSEVALGFHFCFGTFGGWPRFAPENLDRTVELVNASVAATGRAVDWVHIPTLDRVDEAFYAPLSKLDIGKTRVYLGLIHSMDSFEKRVEIARRYLPDFGVAAYCGFGRTPPEQIPAILDDHKKAIRFLSTPRK
jgi:hypothetical protein